ncbi:MAG: 23S rRNA (uracil(1939)-C(5))-methyltransferase RlmD [Clostridia bacterium]|nr:23S rRNA (uracil(1939)-C(5))-methyltransferase RlmD [Clostridia bacterium]
MKKNDICLGVVSGYGRDGEGIIKAGDYTVFLPFAIPGEKVRFRVLKVQKNIVFAKVEEVLTPAEERARPKCPVFGKCGGCQLMHVEYNQQLVIKRELITNCFKKIAFINATPSKVIASTPAMHYRNKLQLPVRKGADGVVLGFFAVNSHRVVPVNDCVIHGEWCAKVIGALKKYMTDKGITAYDELSHSGAIRHLVVKKIGFEYIVILVVNGVGLPNLSYFTNLLEVALGARYSLFINVNTRQDNVILTDQFIKVYGDGYVNDTFLGVNYQVGPATFMQVNEYIKGRLYSRVSELVSGEQTVIDAYCGGGLLTAIIAKKCGNAIGIEIVPEAIECANQLAKDNQINNVRFICGSCEDHLPQIIAENPNAALVLDPPRKGLDKQVALAILKSKPRRIIYVSCSPQTLARDIAIIGGTLSYDDSGELKKKVDCAVNCQEGEILPNGYKIDFLCGYDMFAQCKGVETICALTLVE